jgi:hypothetical protein
VTVAEVNKVFGHTHQRHASLSNWYVWLNPAALINASMDVATVKFINGIFEGTSPSDKYIVGSSKN